eukprot:CAMPEP_0172521582 /NCGR_PEP_ID=MMETSP1066-20121228/292662_1 /TAXON_ID=671091 /ORGANISM="Coscinodiscus wailesii, Strain CCMP2513" /LENGTH=469 /DNA_ID=CAMNT_0013304515 /DNA_START=39 /DNA_END=1448 /DNA_ORIENTATION=+
MTSNCVAGTNGGGILPPVLVGRSTPSRHRRDLAASDGGLSSSQSPCLSALRGKRKESPILPPLRRKQQKQVTTTSPTTTTRRQTKKNVRRSFGGSNGGDGVGSWMSRASNPSGTSPCLSRRSSVVDSVDTNCSRSGTGRCGVCSLRGYKPDNPYWVNQDGHVVSESGPNDATKESIPQKNATAKSVFAVFDGHGNNGHVVSSRCADKLPLFLSRCDYDQCKAFAMMHNDISAAPVDASSSGVTCVCIVWDHNQATLQVASVGDSRAVMGRSTSAARDKSADIVVGDAVPLTIDQKPDDADEKARIVARGGIVGSRDVLFAPVSSHRVFGAVVPSPLPMGPQRVWYKSGDVMMGLAMSRSLGDTLAHSCGVSHTPLVNTVALSPRDEFVIVATDGLWDVMSNEDAVDMVCRYAGVAAKDRGGSSPSPSRSCWCATEAARLLAGEARMRWERESHVIDDITVMVIQFKNTT